MGVSEARWGRGKASLVVAPLLLDVSLGGEELLAQHLERQMDTRRSIGRWVGRSIARGGERGRERDARVGRGEPLAQRLDRSIGA